MAEEEELKPYVFTLPDGTTREGSEGYTGKASVEYENGDKYDGEFIDGVRSGLGAESFLQRVSLYELVYEPCRMHATFLGISRMVLAQVTDRFCTRTETYTTVTG